MDLDEILAQLAELPSPVYRYVLLAALVGPLALRMFGLKALAGIIRPLAIIVFMGGMYAKQRVGHGGQRGRRDST